MLTPTMMKTTLAAVTLVAAYSVGTLLPARDCLTAEEIATAQANAWQGISLSCNESVRLARVEEHGLQFSGIESIR